ncbi:MAG: 2-C-methyl-D-erythritol 4-phosphate cytidylyltransferase, partial [Granulosicoccaceae bacterium]
LFQLQTLCEALENGLTANAVITDESSAMELAGFKPVLVQGSDDNIKVTRPDDVTLAEQFLRNQR